MCRRFLLLTFLVFGLVAGASASDRVWDMNTGLIGYFPMEEKVNDIDVYSDVYCEDCEDTYAPCNDVNLEMEDGAFTYYDANGGGLKTPSKVLFLWGNDEWTRVQPDDDNREDKPFGNSDITAEVTVACWMKTSGTFSSMDTVVGFGYGWHMFGTPYSQGRPGTVSFQVMNSQPSPIGQDGSICYGNTRVDDDEWHHVAATFDGTEYLIYVDGVQDANLDAAVLIQGGNVSYEVTVGAHYRSTQPGPYRFFDGEIDSVYIWKTALSQREIQYLLMEDAIVGDHNGFFPVNPPGTGAEEVESVLTLEWWAGDDANDANGHKVYWSADFNDVNDGTALALVNDVCQPQTATTYAIPVVLEPNTVYYWKVNEVNSPDAEEWAGAVLSFRVTLGPATDPDPFSGKTNVLLDVVLSWTGGDFAEDVNGHEVYFSTDFDEVNDLNTAALVDDVCQPQTETTYDPPLLMLGETYYWAVNEVNATLAMPTPAVWSFKVSEYKVIDDFEGYVDDAALQLKWSKVGWAYPYLAKYSAGYPAHIEVEGDVNSMRFEYTSNGVGNKKLVRTWVADQNWIADNTKILTLYLHGLAENDEALVKVTLEDANTPIPNTASVTYGDFGNEDPNIIANEWDASWDERWHRWDIELSRFSGVTLSEIRKLTITIGDTSIAQGNLFVDDIRLYIPYCVTEEALGDFDGDCESDWDDMEVLNNDWLMTDLLRTDFNEPIRQDPCFPRDDAHWWVAGHDGNDPNALQFDVNDWVDINDMLLEDFQDKTMTMWFRLDELNTDGNDLYIFGSSHYTQRLNIFVGGEDSTIQAGLKDKLVVTLYTRGLKNDESGTEQLISPPMAKYDLVKDAWVHIGVKVINQGPPERPRGVARVYINGLFDKPLIDPNLPIHRLWGPLVGAVLGSKDNGAGNGEGPQMTLSDFRIYDEVINPGETSTTAGTPDPCMIAIMNDTYTQTTPMLWYKFNKADPNDLIAVESSGISREVYYPLETYDYRGDEGGSPAETYSQEARGSKIVNFKDYALMAAQWLSGDKDLWPPSEKP